MPNFRLAMSPGVLYDLSETILVSLTSPRTATAVTLRLVEMDSWQYLRDTMSERGSTGRENFAEFTGAVTDGHFVPATTPDAPDDATVPAIHVQFEGADTVYDIPLPNVGLEGEGGELEVGIHIEGTVGTAEREYVTPNPVFVRHPRVTGQENRAIITFITSDDEEDPYYREAMRYWEVRADSILTYTSLQRIFEYLNTHALPGGQPWGQINIVAHGMGQQWQMGLLYTDRAEWVTPSMIRDRVGHGSLTAPPEERIDSNTSIILRGCQLGRNQDMLDAVRELFGGRCKVLAPRYIQTYQRHDETMRELFYESFMFYVPGSSAPATGVCETRLRAAYSERSDVNFRTLVRNPAARHDSRPALRMQMVVENTGDLPANEAAYMAALDADWVRGEDSYFTDRTDWRWTHAEEFIETRNEQPIHDITFTGTRYRVEVRQVLEDSSDNVVVPDITNTDHFGRSPA